MIEIHQGKFNEGEIDPVNASGHIALKMEKLCNDKYVYKCLNHYLKD